MTDPIAALHDALLAIPDADRDYTARFVRANAALDRDALLAKWAQDQADRQQAADIERHRKEKVLSEFLDTFGEDAVATVAGAQSDADANATNTGE